MRQVVGDGANSPADGAPRILLDRADIQVLFRQMADSILTLAWPRDKARSRAGAAAGAQQAPALWLVGIHRGGVQVAKELADAIALSEGWRPLLGGLDITLYRDDAWLRGPQAVETDTQLPGDPTGQRIVLVDDVLFTGRTTRAALSVLLDFGRPEAVRLAVLLDRDGRELPIAPDVVGQVIEIDPRDSLELRYDSIGRVASVVIERKP